MIRYTLTCAEGHSFDGRFQSGDAYDTLKAAGMVSCAVCGGSQVEKGLMTPSVATEGGNHKRPLTTPQTPLEQALADLRRHVEEHSHDVGLQFVQTAREMHQGQIPHRPIHGEARLDEARKLLEDGVPIAPLPFAPTRKTN